MTPLEKKKLKNPIIFNNFKKRLGKKPSKAHAITNESVETNKKSFRGKKNPINVIYFFKNGKILRE